MLIHPGNHIGDTWYYVEGDVAHCYYLTCPVSIPRHTVWDIAHATSSDLVHWELQGVVLRRGNDDEWDGGASLATGSVIRFNDHYWLSFTGQWSGPRAAVGLAVSDDLHDWTKVAYNPITTIDLRYYEEIGSGSRPMPHWRDPFLFAHEGSVYHYVCASRNDGPTDARGTVGVARSQDMVTWEILPPPQIDRVAQELECPQARQIGHHYFLIFSAFPDLFSAEVRAKHGDSLRHGTYALVGESAFGPFAMKQFGPILPASYPVQPYAAQVVRFGDAHYLLGTVWNDEQDFVCDPVRLMADGDQLVVAMNQ